MYTAITGETNNNVSITSDTRLFAKHVKTRVSFSCFLPLRQQIKRDKKKWKKGKNYRHNAVTKIITTYSCNVYCLNDDDTTEPLLISPV